MHPVVKKLSTFASFSKSEEEQVEHLFSRTQVVADKEVIAWEDEPAEDIIFVMEGFVHRAKMLTNGRRQILAFMSPGDACDRGVSILDRRDHSLVALGEGIIARVSHQKLEALLTETNKLRDAFQWATLVEESIAREWITNIGQREAPERAAHLFCEMFYKLRAIDQVEGMSYRLPLTQRDLSDAIATSEVHANRVLQALRAQHLIAFGDKRLTILDLQGLERFAGFDPTYLHLSAKYRQT